MLRPKGQSVSFLIKENSMKKNLLTLAIIASVGFAAPVFASSCYEDAMQMHDQILQYGSITTSDHFYQLHDVNKVTVQSTQDTICHAQGYRYGRTFCDLTWTKANWGDTLVCE